MVNRKIVRCLLDEVYANELLRKYNNPQEILTFNDIDSVLNENDENEEIKAPKDVETLEEILIQGKETFIDSGGENFDMVPCLNDNDDHINLLKSLIQKSI